MSKTPTGFRAVRYCDSRRVYYCAEEEDGCFKVTSDDGKVRLLVEPGAFKKLFCQEYSESMPPVVRARFDGKPSFAAWWNTQQKTRGE